MKPARIVFPGFWFGQSSLKDAEALARRGVGGFCVYGGTAKQTLDFTKRMQDASPYGQLLFCADINENLNEVVTDAPELPLNIEMASAPRPQDAVYRKGNLLARMARSMGLNWVLAPVVDLGYASPSFGENPTQVTQMAGDFIAGLSNGGVLNCVKYFPGVSGVLKTLTQLEDEEFVPYKCTFRRADALMPSDMIFPNIDSDQQAMLSDKVIKGILKKRLNYKGCVISFPLFKGHLRYEEASAIKMLHGGIENIMSPEHADTVIDAIEREADRGLLTDEIFHAISNQEMFISKVQMGPEAQTIKEAFALAKKSFKTAAEPKKPRKTSTKTPAKRAPRKKKTTISE